MASLRITVNHHVANYLSERNKVSYEVIHNGPLIVPDTQKKMDVSRSSLVFVGNIHARYGLDNVIRALPLVRESKSDVTLDIYGDGPHAQNLKSLTQELGVGQIVRFHGRYDPVELPDILSNHSIGIATLVKCKQNDLAIPVKATEYIASGTPFICSNLETVKLYFQNFGIEYVDYDDSRKIAFGILKMIDEYHSYREDLKISTAKLTNISWSEERRKFIEFVSSD